VTFDPNVTLMSGQGTWCGRPATANVAVSQHQCVVRTAHQHVIGSGFEYDVHSVVGAPKESFIKIEKAEDGGIDGKGKWRPVTRGLRPGSESEVMKKYLSGGFYQAQ